MQKRIIMYRSNSNFGFTVTRWYKPARTLFLLVFLKSILSIANAEWKPSGVTTPRGYLIADDEPNSRMVNLLGAMRFGATPFKSTGKAMFIGYGHSAGNGKSMEASDAAPDRSLALAIVHLSAGGSSSEPQIYVPTLLMTSWRDFPHEMLEPAMSRRVSGASYLMAMKPSGVHDWSDSEVMMHPFFQQVFLESYPFESEGLDAKPRRIAEEEGWLVFATDSFPKYGKIAPVSGYSGNLYNSMWAPNEYIARTWRAFISGNNDFNMNSPSMEENRFASAFSYGIPITASASKPKEPYKEITLWDGDVPLAVFGPNEDITYTSKNFAVGCHAFFATATLTNGTNLTTRNNIVIIRSAGADVFMRMPFATRRPVKGMETKLKAWAKTYDASSISKVEFFVGTQSIGSSTSSPYEVAWTPAQLGEQVVKAVLHSSKGNEIHSWPVKMTVIDKPVATSIKIQPSLALLKPGSKQKFTAIVRDQYDFVMSPQPSISFSSQGGGTLGASEFTAGATLGEAKVVATAASLTSSAIIHVTNALHVNFGPGGYGTDGYLKDNGGSFDDKGNGYKYGWVKGSRHSRARTVNADVWGAKATFIPLRVQFSPPWNKGWGTYSWEAEVPNGDYTVRLCAGDPDPKYDVGQWTSITTQHVHRIKAEDVLVVNDTAFLDNPVIVGTKDVTVKDGKLTITNVWQDADDKGLSVDDKAIRTNMGKVCFVEITPKGEPVLSMRNPMLFEVGPKGLSIGSFQGSIIASVDESLDAKVQIISANGKMISNKSLHLGVGTSLAENLRPGNYIVRIQAPGLKHSSLIWIRD